MSLIAVITTLPSREQAQRLARSLVEQRLVACAQMEDIESVYLWEGQLMQDKEIRLTLKAPADRYEAIEQAILAEHPYDLPAIHALPLERVHGPYGEWILALGDRDSTAGKPTPAAPISQEQSNG